MPADTLEPLQTPTITVPAVAPILGMSASSVYASLKEGTFPFPFIRIGGRIVIPTAPIRAGLGLDTDEPKAVE